MKDKTNKKIKLLKDIIHNIMCLRMQQTEEIDMIFKIDIDSLEWLPSTSQRFCEDIVKNYEWEYDDFELVPSVRLMSKGFCLVKIMSLEANLHKIEKDPLSI